VQAPAQPSAAEQAAAAAEAQRQQAAAAEAERKRVAAAAAEQQRQQTATQAAQTAPAQPARASNELRVVSQPSPRYPAEAQRAGITGSVQVEFTVATDGSVSDARAVSSSAPRRYARDFEREAVAAVRRWQFQPVSQATTSRRTISFQQ
jgi:protein TonB